jgi:nitroreductase
MIGELVRRNRSYRRFDESIALPAAKLRTWIDNARHSASAMNAQPLRYILCTNRETTARIFPLLKWAGALPDWPGPTEGERPTAYIVVLHDTEVEVKGELVWCDLGLASQNILLSAAEEGYGGCIIASADTAGLREVLAISERYQPLVVISLGAPAEDVRIVDLPPSRTTSYYRNRAGTHFVPKRSLEELILASY